MRTRALSQVLSCGLVIPPIFNRDGFIDDIAVMSGALAKLTTFVNADVQGRVNDLMPSKCL
jgi:uncharacterized membrane protein YkvA (DUF1232 family)